MSLKHKPLKCKPKRDCNEGSSAPGKLPDVLVGFRKSRVRCLGFKGVGFLV